MRARDLTKVPDADLLAEIQRNTDELIAMGERPTKVSGFDKLDWSVGLGLTVAGITVGGPITPIGLVLTGLGAGWLGFVVLRRLARQVASASRSRESTT